MDIITLTGVEARGTHGVLDQEKESAQTFLVDAVMEVDLNQACRGDNLVDTVSYAQIASRIVSVVEGEHVDLIERLAQKIADSILLSYRIRRVTVTVHKPQAPLGLPFADVSVTIVRDSPLSDDGSQKDLSVSKASQAAAKISDTTQAPAVHHAVISLGANMGNTADTLRSAVVSLDAIPGNQVTGISPLYRSKAWGMPEGTPDFSNALVQLDTRLEAEELLSSLHMIEAAHGRSHKVHWDSRPLDLDIIDFDGRLDPDPHLTLPHPRAWQRAFVLAPWLDLDPHAVLPGNHGGAVADLLKKAPDKDVVEKTSDKWILGGLV